MTIEFYDNVESPTVVVRATNYPMAELSTLFDRAFGALFPALAASGLTPAGPALALYTRLPEESVDIEVGIEVATPLTQSITAGDLVLEPSVLPAGPAARTTYRGPYDGLGSAWQSFAADVQQQGRTPSLPFWEVYVTEPTPDLDPATLQTDLHTRLEP